MDEWTNKLSDYLDDELTPAERRAVEEHLAGCAECTHTLGELRRVVERARALPSRPPGADLWSGIERRMSAGGTIAAFRPLRPAQRFSFTLPQLAAAAVLIAAVSGTVAVRLAGPRAGSTVAPPAPAVATQASQQDPPAETSVDVATVSFADAQYDAAVADLEKAVKTGRGKLDPSTIAAIEQSLQTIDQAIEQARQALEADPANSYLSGHLVETRRRKLELLRRAAALTETN
jgi:hypothetical protein